MQEKNPIPTFGAQNLRPYLCRASVNRPLLLSVFLVLNYFMSGDKNPKSR